MLSLASSHVNDQASAAIMGIIIISLLAADVVLPTPSSVLSVAAALYFGPVLGSIIIFVGMTLCCLFGYQLGYTGHAMVKKYTDTSIQSDAWYVRWGHWSLLLCRPIPVLAETTVILAGITKIPLKKFMLYTLPANAAVALIYGVSSNFVHPNPF